MRLSCSVALFLGLLCLISARSSLAMGAHEKQRVLVLAIDSSGSMLHTDPQRRRIEAAQLLLAAADPGDQIGVMSFGDAPHWLGQQQLANRSQFPFGVLQNLGQSEEHTDFAALFREWNRFLDSEPDGFFDTHEVQLVLLTDGVPDAALRTPRENANDALRLASRASQHSTINVITLGPEAMSGTFLSDLVSAGHGRSAYADTDAALTDAFLKVATVVLRLPAFQRFQSQGRLQDFGPADRSLLIFLGSGHPISDFGEKLLETPSVKVFDAGRLEPGSAIAWAGSGSVFFCRRENLQLRSPTELPPAGLLDQPPSLSFRLYNGDRDQAQAFFLSSSELQILARLVDGGSFQTLPLSFSSNGEFRGRLNLSEAGLYRLVAKLRAPYGDVEQALGDFRASQMAVNIPRQVTLGVYPGVPNRLLRLKTPVNLLLPVGSARITFNASGDVVADPLSMQLLPNQTGRLSLWTRKADGAGDVFEVPYTVVWNEGSRISEGHAVLRVALRKLTLPEVVRAVWVWLVLIALVVLSIAIAWKTLAPRCLRGKFQVSRDGSVIYSLVLPEELRSRSIEVRSNHAIATVTRKGSVIEIPSDKDETLLTVESRRRQGRWAAVARPGSSRVQAAGQNIYGEKSFAEVPRSQLTIPSQNLIVTFR
jgi:von Willebrand factor type A domain